MEGLLPPCDKERGGTLGGDKGGKLFLLPPPQTSFGGNCVSGFVRTSRGGGMLINRWRERGGGGGEENMHCLHTFPGHHSISVNDKRGLLQICAKPVFPKIAAIHFSFHPYIACAAVNPFFLRRRWETVSSAEKGIFLVPFLLQLRPRLDQQYIPQKGVEERYNAIFLKGMPRNVVISSAIIKNAHEKKKKWGWQDGIMQHPSQPFSLSFPFRD